MYAVGLEHIIEKMVGSRMHIQEKFNVPLKVLARLKKRVC
jgi:hypothetical protein